MASNSPSLVLSRFAARRTLRAATFLALAFSALVASKSIGYATAYTTVQARAALSVSFGDNVGLRAIFGVPHHLETVPGFAAWNSFIAMAIIGAIWGYLAATRIFRGEEDAGRWELLLAGPVTPGRVAAATLAGLATSLGLLFAVLAITFSLVGSLHNVGFGFGAALFFALATTASVAVFMAVGALASQIMPTRGRAAALATGVFGLCFMLRAAADITSAHWLLNLTPLGWIERLQPLSDTHAWWFLPIGLLIAILVTATVVLASRRDLGASLVADRDSAKARTFLLRGPLTATIRLTRGSSLSWLLVITVVTAFFSLLTKTAAQAFGDSATAQHIFNHLTQNASQMGAKSFLGAIFLILMTLVMCYAAGASGAMREDEAKGYLDNLLVQPVGRWRWLLGRIGLATSVIILATLLIAMTSWLVTATQNIGLSFHSLLLASLNVFPPAFLILGFGIFALGLMPRFTTVVAYGIVAWSFLIQLLSSGVNLSHWILDTAIFTHVALAPAADPKWGTNVVLVGLGLALCLIGGIAFNNRDLANE
jgi:ABC-2 type transport system permease protein